MHTKAGMWLKQGFFIVKEEWKPTFNEYLESGIKYIIIFGFKKTKTS